MIVMPQFMVEDLQLIIDKLKHARMAYTLSRSGRTALFCRDPDNNTLEFIQVDPSTHS